MLFDELRGWHLMQNNFWIRLLGIAAVIYGLYYLVSPYQNCLRSGGGYAEYIELRRKWGNNETNPFMAAPPANPFMAERFRAPAPPPPKGFIPVGAKSEKEWRRDRQMQCIRIVAG